MKILLIQTPNIKGSFLNLPGKEIPLAFCYMAAYLKQQGFDQVRILDLDFAGNVSPYLEEELARFEPDLTGITSYTTNIAIAAEIASTVKQLRPGTSTVIGGFHASALPERTLNEFPQFDYLVFGEGEITLTELAGRLAEGGTPDGIPGVALRKNGRVELGPPRPFIEPLDSLPMPDRSLVPVQRYIPDPGNYFQLPSTGILFSRGCPFHCTYCSKSVFLNHIRYRSVDNFLEEIEQCEQSFGIRDFRLEDEGPTANPKKVKELCRAILSRNLRITWNCFSRVDVVDYEFLTLMKKAGCYHITYGIESSNPQTLERIKKKIDLSQAENVVRWTKKVGIECKVNFIFGFPWETVEDMKRTIRYSMQLAPDLVSFNIFKPLPGSVLYQQMNRDGEIKHTSWEDYFVTSEALLFDASFTEKDLRRLIRWAFLWFYFRPRFVLQRFVRFVNHPKRELATIGKGLKILAKELWLIIKGRPAPASRTN